MNNETIPKVDVDVVYEEENPVIYQKKDNIAFLTLNRTKYHNEDFEKVSKCQYNLQMHQSILVASQQQFHHSL
jgi:hypothetical protein